MRRHSPTILVVDDHEANRVLLEGYLSGLDCRVVTASDGPSALELVSREALDLVLLDVQMPGLDGLEVCRRIKADPQTRLLPVVMITALNETQDRVRALEAGADDFMAKPVDRIEVVARATSALRLKSVYDSLDSAEHVIFALAAAVEAKDRYTEAHTERVAMAARHVGERLRLQPEDLDVLYRGGKVHDIGKIGVPDTILGKQGPLTPDEFTIIRRHPEIGESILLPLRTAAALLPIVRHHHENWDGTGYPDGLAETAIPLSARIVAVCDAFDSMTSDRPYRRGRSRSEAIEVLIGGRGRQWDPDLVDLFAQDPPQVEGGDPAEPGPKLGSLID